MQGHQIGAADSSQAAPAARAHGRVAAPLGRRVLVLATEWFSWHGGVSTFNRSWCAALADAGHEVACLVPEATAEEREDALSLNVRIIECPRTPGLGVEARLLLPLTVEFVPDVVMGHGHVTGPAAAARVEHFHRRARRVHILHTTPEELEWLKNRDGDPAERAARQQICAAELARSATLAVAVGPRLERDWNTYMRGMGGVQVCRITPGLPSAAPVEGPPVGFQVLVLGRAEDVQIKGIDIAAAALGRMRASDVSWQGEREPTLVVRGAQRGTGGSLRDELRRAAGTGIRINVKEYTSDPEEVCADIRRASVVLMPSRAEGFGLAALEALAMGVPVLVSRRSGLADAMQEIAVAFPDLSSSLLPYLVDVQDDPARDSATWADAISRVLTDLPRAFTDTREIRGVLAREFYWRRAVDQVFTVLGGTNDIVPVLPIDDFEKKKGEFLAWAQSDPVVAIAMASGSLETEIQRAASARGVARSSDVATQLEALEGEGAIARDVAGAARERIRRRDIVVHGSGLMVLPEDARSEIIAVEWIVTELRKLA